MAGLDDVRILDLRDCIASIALSGGKPAIHETEEIVTNLRQVDSGRDLLSEFGSEVQFQMQTRPLLGGNQISPFYANAMMNADEIDFSGFYGMTEGGRRVRMRK